MSQEKGILCATSLKLKTKVYLKFYLKIIEVPTKKNLGEMKSTISHFKNFFSVWLNNSQMESDIFSQSAQMCDCG